MNDSATARDAARVAALFLDQVEREAVHRGLSADARLGLRDRLQGQIDAGIDAAREGQEVPAALAIIDALGTPESLVAAVGAQPGIASGPTFYSPGAQASASDLADRAAATFEQVRERGGLEAIACLLIVLNPVVPAGGLLVCLVCLLLSSRWTTGEKVLGAFGALLVNVALFGLVAPFVLGPGLLPLGLIALLIPIWIAVHLWIGARIPAMSKSAGGSGITLVAIIIVVLVAVVGLFGLATFYVGG